MDPDLAQYYGYCNTVKNLVYRAGIWPYREDTGPFYSLLTCYSVFTLITGGTKLLVHSISVIDNMQLFFPCILSMITQYSSLLRMICFLVYRKKLVSLDKKLGSTFDDKLKSDQNRPTLLKKVYLYPKFMHFYNSSLFLSGFLYYIPVAIKIFKYKQNVQFLEGKYPFPVEPRGTVYWIIIAFETSNIWFLLHGMTSVDSTFNLNCFRLSGLLRLATEGMGSLDPNNSNCRNQLRECVTMHQLVIRAKVALQAVHGIIFIWTYVTSAILICGVLWMFDQMKSQVSIMRLLFIIMYIAMKLMQAFIFSYYGSTITTESENYRDAVYASSWPESGNVRLMKDLLIILMQRDITLKACGYFMMTMEFLDKICNTAISYFLLLRSLDTQN